MSDSNNDIDWDDENQDTGGTDEFSSVTAPPSSVTPPPVFGGSTDIEAVDVTTVDTTNAIIGVETNGESEHVTVIQLDSNGNEQITVVDMALPPLDESEAREITEKIKGTTNLLYLLIKRAHAGKAYKALGYSSFEAYVREEFNYSRSYAYKLLNQANVIEAIESIVPEGTEIYVGELTARGLKGSLPELLEDIEERTADASPEDSKHLVEEAIRDLQERQTEENDAYEDFDAFDEDGEFGGNDFTPGGGNEFIDDDDESLDEFLGSEDPTQLVKKLEGLWNLITGLQTFSDLSESTEIDDLLSLITDDKVEEVTRLIGVNIEWLARLNEAWNVYRENLAVSDDTDEDNDDEDDFDEINFD